MSLTVIFAALAVTGLGTAIYFRGRLGTAESANTTLQARLDTAERERAQAVADVAQQEAVLETERHGHAAQLDQLQQETTKKLELVAGTRRQQADQMKAIAGDVLKQTTEQLMSRAEEARKADREMTVSELNAAKKDIEAAVAPVGEQMGKLETQVQLLEQDRKRTEGSVKTMFENLQAAAGDLRLETGRLVSALKRPNVRGSWGEMQLKGVVRAAGMTEHVDFHSQPVLDDGPAGRLRPDMTVHLPSERDVVVDSKVPLDAFLAAIDTADDPDLHGEHLDRHARQLKRHVDKLASKAYHAQLDTQAEFVVCFLPNEAVYCAALDRDPSLLEHGVANRVLIATPTTLLALLHACTYGWRQSAIEESAREIVEAARVLHRRFGIFFGEFIKTGRLLGQTINSYNIAAGSAEARLLPQLRRMEESGAASEKRIESPKQVDTPPRLVSAPEADDATLDDQPPAEAA